MLNNKAAIVSRKIFKWWKRSLIAWYQQGESITALFDELNSLAAPYIDGSNLFQLIVMEAHRHSPSVTTHCSSAKSKNCRISSQFWNLLIIWYPLHSRNAYTLWNRFKENTEVHKYAKCWMLTAVHFTTICFAASVKMLGLKSAVKNTVGSSVMYLTNIIGCSAQRKSGRSLLNADTTSVLRILHGSCARWTQQCSNDSEAGISENVWARAQEKHSSAAIQCRAAEPKMD